MSNQIEDFLRERDAERLVMAREADEVMRPITAFARGHMSHTQSLLARWPDFDCEEERIQAVRIWYAQLDKRMQSELDKWFKGDRSANLRSEYIAACFREAIAQFLGADARSNAPEAKLARERLTGRAIEIADLLSSRVAEDFREPHAKAIMMRKLTDRIIIIILWGEHGAHFPDS